MNEIGYRFPNLYQKGGNRRSFYTKSAYPGTRHFDEFIIKEKGFEFRAWDPNRSKLGAAIAKGIGQIGMHEGDTVLYLGAGHGFTPSYVSDILGKNGMVFCVDFAPRVVRDLVFVCETRDNMAPIMGDANKPDDYKKLLPKQIDALFMDVAQKNQVQIFKKNMKLVKKDGFGLLALKARSVDVTKKPREIFAQVRKELEEDFKVVDSRELAPFEKDHCIFICKNG